MATPFASQPQSPRPFNPAESLGVTLGTAAESAIDTVSFGIFSPDIIPEQQEIEHPWATTVGRIMGSTAGLLAPGIGSMGTATKATKGLLGAFRWGSKYNNFLSSATKLAASGKLPLQSLGMGAAVFAVHDSAREIIRQTKEQQPDLYEVGLAAVKGGVFGGILGFMGDYSNTFHWNKQGMTMASAMAVAESISDAADGVDVFSVEWAKSRLPAAIIQGYAIGLWNSRGWQKRAFVKETLESEAIVNLAVERGLAVKTKDGYKATEKRIMDELLKKRPGITIKEIPKEIKDAVTSYSKFATSLERGAQIEGTAFKSEKAAVHQFAKETGLITKKSDAPYKAWLKQQTGKTSSKDLTREDWDGILKGVNEYTANTIKTHIGDTSMIGEYGLYAENIKAPNKIMREIGALEFTNAEQVLDARLLMRMEQNVLTNNLNAIHNRWKRLYKAEAKSNPNFKPVGTKEIIRSGLYKEATPADKLLAEALEGKSFKTLSPQMQDTVQDIKNITKLMHGRYNEVMKAIGLPEIGYFDWYLPHQIDWVKAKKMGLPTEGLDPSTWSMSPWKRMNEHTKLMPEFKRTINQYPIKQNPWEMLDATMRTELKGIYLHEPIGIVKRQLQDLEELGVYTAAQARDVEKLIEIGVWGKRPDIDVRAGKSLEAFFEKNDIGKIMQKVALQFNRELGNNLPAVFSNVWGKAVSMGYIGFRPVLAIRNLFQFTYAHGFASTKNLAKGLLGTDNALVKEFKTNNPQYKFNTEMAGEHIGTTSGLDTVMFKMYGKSHVSNVDITIRTMQSQVSEYMTSPKYEKLGWATPEGIKLRANLKAAGNPDWRNAFTDKEKGYMFQEMEYVMDGTQFLYDAIGLPMASRSNVKAPFIKLLSYPMNYVTKFLPELAYRAIKGQPYWARGTNIRLPISARVGGLRHFAALSGLLMGLEKMGLDYSSLLGIGYTPKHGLITPFDSSGVLNARPSPLVNGLIYMKDWMAGTEQEKKIAIRQIKSMVPVPGIMFAKDIQKVSEKGEVGRLLFKYSYEKKPSKSKKKPSPFPTYTPFKPPSVRPFGG